MNIAMFMTPKVCSSFVHADDSVRQGFEVLRNSGFTAIPVVDKNEKYIGCFTEGDILRYSHKCDSTSLKDYEKEQIKNVIRENFCPSVNLSEDISKVFTMILEQNFIPIVDDRNIFSGIITRSAVLKHLLDENTLMAQPSV